MMTKKQTVNASKTDWQRVEQFSELEIERMALADHENPASSAADWADAVVGLPLAKTPVNAKFDVEVVDWFKSQGRGYQSRMNAVLRRYMEVHRKAG
jgi:uncharacterized protein (DUF4415 family)